MLRILVAVLVIAFAVPVLAADKVCIIASRQEFFDSVAKIKPTIYRAAPKALAAIIAKINEPRAKAGQFPIEADEFYVGIFTTDKGILMAGVVMFKDGCIVPGTVTSMPIDQWAAFMAALGISRDDFYDVREAAS